MIPLYTFFGMKRCGQHAVIHWICKQHGGNITYRNNCDLHGCGRGAVTTYKEGNEYGAWNFEDPSIDKIHKVMKSNRFHGAVPIMIIRDPYNWIASCLHRLVTTESVVEHDVALRLPERIELYKEHIRTIIKGVHVISFNEWFVDAKYRSLICYLLKIPFTDDGIDEVSRYGGGSSFDKRKHNGTAQHMKVLERWKYYRGNEEYWKYIDAELVDIADSVFNLRGCYDKS